MKKFIFVVSLCLVMISSVVSGAMAESEPIQLSLTPEIAVHDKNTEIRGLSLNIWGENPQTGLALGIANGSRGDSKGFSLGLLLNYSESYTGVQWGLVNYSTGNFVGWQLGAVNFVKKSVKGLQTGFVNYADKFTGLQLGFINYADKPTNALQIGLINVMPQNEWFKKAPNELAPAMIIVNWRF